MKFWHICNMSRLHESLIKKRNNFGNIHVLFRVLLVFKISYASAYSKIIFWTAPLYINNRDSSLRFYFVHFGNFQDLYFFNMICFHLLNRRILSKSLILAFSKAVHGHNILINHYIQCWHYSVAVLRQQSKIYYHDFLWLSIYIKLWLSLIIQ